MIIPPFPLLCTLLSSNTVQLQSYSNIPLENSGESFIFCPFTTWTLLCAASTSLNLFLPLEEKHIPSGKLLLKIAAL